MPFDFKFRIWRHRAALGLKLSPAAAYAAGAVVVLSCGTAAFASLDAARSLRHGESLAIRLDALKHRRDQVVVAAAIAAEPPDFVRSLPDAPTAAQVMRAIERSAGREGARLTAFQSDDVAPTSNALGRLDITVTLRASYPGAVAMISEVLDRYPDATLREARFARANTALGQSAVAPERLAAAVPAGAAPLAALSMTESDLHLTLAFWRRPVGVAPQRPRDETASVR